MLIDSHCHLDRIDLKPYQNDFACFMHEAEANQIEHLLCIAIDLESYPAMLDLVAGFPTNIRDCWCASKCSGLQGSECR